MHRNATFFLNGGTKDKYFQEAEICVYICEQSTYELEVSDAPDEKGTWVLTNRGCCFSNEVYFHQYFEVLHTQSSFLFIIIPQVSG